MRQAISGLSMGPCENPRRRQAAEKPIAPLCGTFVAHLHPQPDYAKYALTTNHNGLTLDPSRAVVYLPGHNPGVFGAALSPSTGKRTRSLFDCAATVQRSRQTRENRAASVVSTRGCSRAAHGM